MHPPACHPRLFECEYNLAARDNLTDPGKRGQYLCELVRDVESGDLWFIVGGPAPDIEGIDWNALVAELRLAREVIRWSRAFRCAHDGCDHLLCQALAAYHKHLEEISHG